MSREEAVNDVLRSVRSPAGICICGHFAHAHTPETGCRTLVRSTRWYAPIWERTQCKCESYRARPVPGGFMKRED